MLLASLRAGGADGATVIREKLKRLADRAGRPISALLWVSDTASPERVAAALHDSCECAIGGVGVHGLIGGGAGGEFREREGLTVLAITLPDGASAVPFHSHADGLPQFAADKWSQFTAATSVSNSPHVMVLASPPTAPALEGWLSRFDAALPWARKVGGVLAGGDGRLWVGGEAHVGGAAGVALSGDSVRFDALVCQGAMPVGPSFEITAVEANLVRALDGKDVRTALAPILEEHANAGGGGMMMAGISVPASRKSSSSGESPGQSSSHAPGYVVRQVLGYFPEHSAISVGATHDLLSAPGARLRLHVFSAAHAREELDTRVRALAEEARTRAGDGLHAPPAGGLLVSCLGRGEALFGHAGVEPTAMRSALGTDLQLSGFFAGGEIGPVGNRTFAHTCGLAIEPCRPAAGCQAHHTPS